MKTTTFKSALLILALLKLSLISSATATSTATVFFQENKGQICDQNNIPRPDVLFSGYTGGLGYHITKTGVSFQLSKPVTNQEAETSRENEAKNFIINRVDLKFLNANISKSNVVLGNEFPGYSNYYLQQCPNGAVNVKAYESVLLSNVYSNIDVKWYEKDGELEYDFIVKPGANISDIKIEVKGAVLTEGNNGSVLMQTEIGTIEKVAPVVYQDGKIVNSSWKVHNGVLTFNVANYDKSKILVIDPVSRVWATYYGGGGGDQFYGSASFSINERYFVGGTGTNSTPTLIATTGSHQSTKAGGFDAMIVKLNSAGVRTWATYYGGNANDAATSCVIDNSSGALYVAGNTASSVGIATSGAHQSNFGGGTNDAFLVKFSSGGFRQWGTYYGGTGDETGFCATDNSTGFYLSGATTTTVSSVISTSGAHQVGKSGLTDAYLVKFDGAGSRQWGTYYGGASNDRGYGCTTDPSGNIYMYGEASSTASISTPGAHQIAGGGGNDAFVAKFNTSGVRQWATYYGGTGFDYGYGGATDASGNFYLGGSTTSNVGTVIATATSNQPVIGGSQDGFLVKFDPSGVRQWGTYYGATGTDGVTAVSCNNSNEVFIAGTTTSPTSTLIATPTTFQAAFGGGTNDAFVGFFNSSGVIQWSSYYGGTGNELGSTCVTDINGGFYLAGETTSNTSGQITTAGAHQTTHMGAQDGFVVKFVNCATATSSLVGQTNLTCNGNFSGTATVSATGGSGFTYSWSPSVAFSATATALAAGNYTCYATNNCGNTSSLTISITEPSPLTVTLSSNNLVACAGVSSTLSASGSGGTGVLTYSWVTGPATASYVASPTVSTIYSLDVTDANSCVTSQTISITRNPSPVVTVNSGSVCSGSSFTMVPSGASTYTYSSGSSVVTPTSNSTYSITGTSSLGCVSTAPAISSVTVVSKPVISVNSGSVCSGSSFTMVPSGASTFTYSSGSAIVTPTATTSYSVSGTNSLGCVSVSVAISSVSVIALPSVSLTVSSSVACVASSFGTSVILTGSPAGGVYSGVGVSGNSLTPQSSAGTYTTVYSYTSSTTGCVNSAASTITVSVCTSVDEIVNENIVSIYPNPSNGEFTIKGIEGKVEIINSIGQTVYISELNSDELKVSGFAAGIYYLRIENSKINKKIVVVN